MRRGAQSAPVSLFSFQDVMVSTIGVTLLIILVLLLLAGREAAALLPVPQLDTDEATVAAPAPEQIEDPTRRQLELLNLDDRIETLQVQLADARDAAQRSRTEALLDGDAALEAARARRLSALQGELESLRTRRRVTYLLDKDDADRVPLIIELGGARAVLGTGTDEDAPLALNAASPTALARSVLEWVEGHPQRHRLMLVFVVRPSGVSAWDEIRRSLPRFSDEGIGYGLDLIAENWSTSGLLPGAREETP